MTDTRTGPVGLEQMICFDLYAANHAFGRVYQPLLEPLGLTYPQYLVMIQLWAEAPLRVGEIGQRLGLGSNTLTPLLKRLEAAGYVTRRRDTDDERRVSVDLTEAGRKLHATADHIPGCVARATGMTMAELRALQAQLRRLSAELLHP
ncbi:MarR family winged helix-turn-helix transcriptional regulator [Thalassococcus sp. BH17M4-6]|uniref:MarR family winged helix-turn-helix transcriptional regulator n=1 Tax=Thalassococcus sp. BH17M4-6 TaxID=3413148 RepID=UPI003BE00B79